MVLNIFNEAATMSSPLVCEQENRELKQKTIRLEDEMREQRTKLEGKCKFHYERNTRMIFV